MSKLAEEIEQLVVDGLVHGKRDESCRLVVAGLTRTVERRSDDAIYWLSGCARLSATEATPLVEHILDQAWSNDVRAAATDAARSVAYDTDHETRYRIASKLEIVCDDLLLTRPYCGARALLGTIVLAKADALPWLVKRLLVWPAARLSLTIDYAAETLSKIDPEARKEIACLPALRDQTLELLGRLDLNGGTEDEYTGANVLELLGALAFLAPTIYILELLLTWSENQHVVLISGAASAAATLMKESPDFEALLRQDPRAAKLLHQAEATQVRLVRAAQLRTARPR